ncbi:MAG: VWA domain-containing protein [Candidatus Korobacteraceae bacterium]
MSAASYQRLLIPAILFLLAIPSLPGQETTKPTLNDKTQSQPAQAEQQAQTPTFSSDVKVVNVLATVRDKKGQIVSTLTQDDFKLEQDGHPQVIHYFAKDTDLPLKLGLLVDTSGSQRRLIEQERIASYGFLNDLMRVEKDKAFIIHFDWDIELLQDLTTSHQKLEAALEKLDTPQFNQASGGGGSGGGGHRGGGTTLYDAIFLASDELMRKQEGRKALILLTDGVDIGSKVSLDRAIETAQKANTLVYSILYADPDAYGHPSFGGPGMGRHGGMGGGGMGRYPGGGGGGYPQQQPSHADGKKVLQRISKETGGRFFEVSKKQPINQIYSEIEDELRNQYNLGFTPAKADATSGYHSITLTTTNKDLIVQTREGYYAGE